MTDPSGRVVVTTSLSSDDGVVVTIVPSGSVVVIKLLVTAAVGLMSAVDCIVVGEARESGVVVVKILPVEC